MALIRTGGASAPSKTLVLATIKNGSEIEAVYNNGAGELIADAYTTYTTPWTASDLVDVSYSNDSFTITFKVNCKVVGAYGATSITGSHAANTTITFGRANFCTAYIYA